MKQLWLPVILVVLSGIGCSTVGRKTVPDKGHVSGMTEHPFLLFCAKDVAGLAQRTNAEPLLAESFQDLKRRNRLDQMGSSAWWQIPLESSAFVATMENDSDRAGQAIQYMLKVLRERDPAEFYHKDADFQYQAMPLQALALAWDWLQPRMTPEQKAEALPHLEAWCTTAFNFTEKQWWREASYNCGAIPVSGYGLLALAIRKDTTNPVIETCYREAVRRIGQNYFPTTWKPSGICYEGPNYAIVGFKYSVLFAYAVARAGGDDLTAGSGASGAMQYLMHQYMPWGGCAPIGDNTRYGRRTFAAEYLLGLGQTRDAEGLWVWRNYTHVRRLDPLITYLWYPLTLKVRNPRDTGMPTSKYFEVTLNRAGYVFSRSAWDNSEAAFFSFTTRFETCNHQHYDMNSFLFGGFGTLFATHRMLFPYPSEKHGVDYEHNMVIINGGGWPASNRTASCGDDNSTEGLLVGLVLSGFADYVRGDAKWSYRDNSIWTSNPAIRAERACLFVKQGPTPYLVVIDDNQQYEVPSKYDWLWHAPSLPARGAGTLNDPLVITAPGGSCALQFAAPAEPALTSQPVNVMFGDGSVKAAGINRISVEQTGVRVRYAALASLQKEESTRPRVALQQVDCINTSAGAITVKLAGGEEDVVAWQSEEDRIQVGSPLKAGDLQTDGLLAMVRVKDGKVTGFVLGEGTYLRWGKESLVKADSSVSVSAGAGEKQVTGRLRTRQGLPPETAKHAEVRRL